MQSQAVQIPFKFRNKDRLDRFSQQQDFLTRAIENTPLIGTLVKGGETVVNDIGSFFRQSSQGYQQLRI